MMQTACTDRRITAVLAILALALAGCSAGRKQPVDYVDPNIGGIGQMLQATQPAVVLPHGMMRIAPITTPGITDRYLADKIYGFPAGGVLLMPMTGEPETSAAQYASLYDHDLETATPYYYSTTLEKNDVLVEYTVSHRAAHYRITFPKGAAAHVLFAVRKDGGIKLLSPTSIEGRETATLGGSYFYAELSAPAAASRTLPGIEIPRERRQPEGAGIGLMADFDLSKGQQVEVRVGMSYISAAQARQNLANEIPEWSFDRTKGEARKAWNGALSKIAVKGGTETERTIFYTALYRTLSRMTDITEGGRYFSAYDSKVHEANGVRFHTNDNLWDTHRTAHPLQLLLDPDRQVDMVKSYVLMYEQSGWLPSAPSLRGGQRGMIGHHATAFITDTYMKGYRGFDVEKAYEGMKKNAMEAAMLRSRGGPATPLERVYMEKGFFPALGKNEKETVPEVPVFEKRQAVSLTLEHAHDDWCLAQMAKALNKPGDYAYFMKRAHNYQNVFDSRVGFMAPKTADGKWKYEPEEFDPIWTGGQGGRDYYTELNAWNYTFHVPHDPVGLGNLLGGKEKFAAKLDALFTEQYRGRPPGGGPGGSKYHFLAWFPDQTGLIGQYSQGNEPSFHIPYLYNYAGQPWKTQRKVREIMKIWYTATPLGIPGDEDGGGLSSWYPLTAMGFYPLCPGRPVYDIGSPIFEETKISLAGGKTFTILARNVSEKNKYIQSATLNGKPLNRPWFEHGDIVNGGTLVLEMGPRANTSWGNGPDAAPPSMSKYVN